MAGKTNISWIIDGGQFLADTGIRKEKGNIEECVIPFKLLDDDGEVYLTGRVSKSLIGGNEETAFYLLDLATADLGCTRFDYRENGEWKTL